MTINIKVLLKQSFSGWYLHPFCAIAFINCQYIYSWQNWKLTLVDMTITLILQELMVRSLRLR